MNSLELSSSLMKNVTFITRMRGSDKSLQNSKNIRTSTNFNDTKSNINNSKSSQLKKNKSAQKLVNKIKDNLKYTMFTSSDSSNIMLVSKKPIKGSTINEALKVCDNLYDFHNSILNETSLLEYDKIYNETYSIEKIYNESIKDNIGQLFHKKNSCVFFFGPSSGGKSYLLRGQKDDINNNNLSKINYNIKYNRSGKTDKDNKQLEGGLLKRSINNILNLIKINKQGNDNSSNIQNKYELIFSAYIIYMDKIYDLLSKEIKNISIEKLNDEDQNFNINLLGLTDEEIRSIQEYEKIIKLMEHNKDNLSKVLKIKNLEKKSHTILSVKLQKKIQNTLGTNVTDKYTINSFSQIDFIELVGSEIGLNDQFQDTNDLSYEYKLYSNTKDVFNSICDNIVCANNGTTPEKESLLTLSLKNTLKANSSIIFFNCVIPWEFPINHSFKALKFTTWLRNQVINEGETINNISVNNNISQGINQNSLIMKNINNNILFNTINENNNYSNMYHNQNTSYFANNYKNPIAQDNSYNNNQYKNQNYMTNNTFPDINNLVGKSIDNGNSKSNILINEENDNNNFNMNEEQNIKLMRSHSGGLIINNKDNDSYEYNNQKKNNNSSQNQTIENNKQLNKSQFKTINKNLSQNEKTLQTLEQTLKELEEKKIEIENKMIEEKNKIYNTNNNYNNINNIKNSLPNIIIPDSLRIKEEQDILKSDNIILREDISRLSETNQNLENEISKNREIISHLQSENQKLKEENGELKSRLKDYNNLNYSQLYLNGQISKEDFLQKSFNERYLLQNRLKDLENNYNNIQKEKMQYEIDYKVLLSKYEEIKNKFEKTNYELLNNRQIHDNELFSIDNKINGLSKEVEKLQMENSELRQDNENQRNILNILTTERDMYKEKFEEKKYENDLLNKKILQVENGFYQMINEKEYERRYYKKQKEENHKNKNDSKNRIAQELQSKIQQFRRERLQRKTNEDLD